MKVYNLLYFIYYYKSHTEYTLSLHSNLSSYLSEVLSKTVAACINLKL